jgi:F-type H+-transporting ATPase subunit a
MAAGLPHPVLISTFVDMDTITLGGQTVEFKHVFYTWMAMAIIFIFGFIVRRRLTLVPGKLQNVTEVLIGGLDDFAVNSAGDKIKPFVPLLITLFIYILVQNVMGLIPLLDAPTANLNTNLGMALCVFILYHIAGIRKNGFSYIKQFTGPMPALMPLMFPVEVMTHSARVLSLTLRLFGNIRGEEIVMLVLFMLAPIISTYPMFFLFLFIKILQAFVFYMLAMIYLQTAMEEAH